MIIAETLTLNPSLVHNRYRTVSMQCVSGNIPPLTGARERLPYLDKDLDGRVKFTVYLPISSSPLANSCRQISTRASSRLAWPDPVHAHAHETINNFSTRIALELSQLDINSFRFR